jgi:hypothetical protein
VVLDEEGAASTDEVRCVRASVAGQRLQEESEPAVALVVEIAAPRSGATP